MQKRVLAIAQNPVFSTAVVCIILYLVAGFTSAHFFSTRVAVNLLQDNAYLGIVAVGVTFVILTGGIDLSVGAIIGWTTIALASMITTHHVHPYLAMAIILAVTTINGAILGSLIHFFAIPPFLMTLAGLFLYRGWALLISTSTISIDHPAFNPLSDTLLKLHTGSGNVPLRLGIFVLLAAFAIAAILTRFTAYGRSLFAIGGSENSALLMGLPVARNKTLVYAISGCFAGIAGIVATTRSAAGDALSANGLELDAIAVAVVGGTLLTGGVGGILGTLIGLLIFGIIQTVVNFHSLDAAWTRIAIGTLLLSFILLQKLLRLSRTSRQSP
ncbi:MAG TPA: sugar ABC transporter permease YjfF [Phycisphaerae bacterium]|nr:sugar ABC transporter permease YjfF [Phycisphaerae bacterium]